MLHRLPLALPNESPVTLAARTQIISRESDFLEVISNWIDESLCSLLNVAMNLL